MNDLWHDKEARLFGKAGLLASAREGSIQMDDRSAAVAIDAGDLPMGGGLLALVRPALQLLEPAGVLAINSQRANLHDDLARWCQLEHHEYLDSEARPDGQGWRHLIARGSLSVPNGSRESGGSSHMPEHADPSSGFAPRGAQVEPGGPRYPFDLIDRDHVAPPEVAALYEQAVASQWNANTDIAWHKVRP